MQQITSVSTYTREQETATANFGLFKDQMTPSVLFIVKFSLIYYENESEAGV
jgi:hypothetical protein